MITLMARKTEHAPSESGQPSHTKKSRGEETFTRADFIRDLKKIAEKQDGLLNPSKKGAEHPAGLVLVVVVKHELIFVLR